MSNDSDDSGLVSVDYEVFGKVQGVYFRKHTQRKAAGLGLKGWVKNTAQGTVVGQLQGPKNAAREMKTWLREVGSPKSKIEKVAFKNECPIATYTFKNFEIRR